MLTLIRKLIFNFFFKISSEGSKKKSGNYFVVQAIKT